jgi:hypothetical protein
MFVLTATPVIAIAANDTPFDTYEQIEPNIFVYDKSQFSPYIGPDVSKLELLDPDEDRRRIGVFVFSPTEKVYVDHVWDPMTEYLEIRSVKNGKLIGKFGFYGGAGSDSGLLFSGQGAVYEYGKVGLLCQGKTTSKFVITGGKLKEVPQPYMYIAHAGAALVDDGKLFYKPNTTSSQVASLPKGTLVTVLEFVSVKNRDSSVDTWFLILTPLGLTGWMKGNLDATSCN